MTALRLAAGLVAAVAALSVTVVAVVLRVLAGLPDLDESGDW